MNTINKHLSNTFCGCYRICICFFELLSTRVQLPWLAAAAADVQYNKIVTKIHAHHFVTFIFSRTLTINIDTK